MHHLREINSGGQKIAEHVDHFQGPIIGLFSPLRMSNGRPRTLHPGRNSVVTFMNTSKSKGVCVLTRISGYFL